jgi:hypothetical protein
MFTGSHKVRSKKEKGRNGRPRQARARNAHLVHGGYHRLPLFRFVACPQCFAMPAMLRNSDAGVAIAMQARSRRDYDYDYDYDRTLYIRNLCSMWNNLMKPTNP